MKYLAVCKRSYTKYGSKFDNAYPIVSVSKYESHVKLPKGDLSVEDSKFDEYFDIVEMEEWYERWLFYLLIAHTRNITNY